MPAEPWSFDAITDDLIKAFVPILSLVSGWGVLADGSKAVYGGLLLPFVQEPFPCAYIYMAGVTHDFGQGTGLRRDLYQVNVRLLGGPLTPSYRFNPEHQAYKMFTGVTNELTYRRYLEDPTNNNAPFRYIDPQSKLTISNSGQRIQAFDYAEQGKFAGIEIPTTIGLQLNIGRLS